MLKLLNIFLSFVICISCNNISAENKKETVNNKIVLPTKICEIPLPKGFERMKCDKNSFAYFLQHFKLNADNTVYYYDRAKKTNQSSHYAVLDIAIGKKDLLQCADAIMYLRAKYFFDRKEYDKIEFKSGNTVFNFATLLKQSEFTSTEKAFEYYIENVFANCGSYNLADMLHTKQNFDELNIGDVFVKGGSPGHAMIVVDVAINKQTKEKIYLLAQGFMPAQSVHIVINPNDEKLSPWYKVDKKNAINTPGYIFSINNLKEW